MSVCTINSKMKYYRTTGKEPYTVHFLSKLHPILDQTCLIFILYNKNCLETIPFTAAHTHIAYIWEHFPLPIAGDLWSVYD